MAYNPNIYGMYGQSYGGQMQQAPQGAQMAYAPQPTVQGMIWVDGEVGAKAQQLPAGWGANKPLPLWDTNDTIIWLKSVNEIGMPNPLQKIVYRMEENVPKHMGQGTEKLMSGETEKYARMEDIDRLREELLAAIRDIGTAKKPAVKGE